MKMAKVDVNAVMASLALSAPNGEGMLELGLFYWTGRQSNLVEALKWLSLSAMRGNPYAAIHRAELAREMDANAVSEATRQAQVWSKVN